MTSKVAICNIALSRCRAGNIDAFDEGSPESIQCNVFYDSTRERLLRSYSWAFAKKERALSLSAATPGEWLYEYDYPNDCIKINYLFIPSQHITNDFIPYEIATGDGGSRKIQTSCKSVSASYVQNVTDTRLFDPLFVDLLSWALCADLAIPLGGDSGKKYRDDAREEMRIIADMAQVVDANEDVKKASRLPKSIEARNDQLTSDYSYNDQFYRRY